MKNYLEQANNPPLWIKGATAGECAGWLLDRMPWTDAPDLPGQLAAPVAAIAAEFGYVEIWTVGYYHNGQRVASCFMRCADGSFRDMQGQALEITELEKGKVH